MIWSPSTFCCYCIIDHLRLCAGKQIKVKFGFLFKNAKKFWWNISHSLLKIKFNNHHKRKKSVLISNPSHDLIQVQRSTLILCRGKFQRTKAVCTYLRSLKRISRDLFENMWIQVIIENCWKLPKHTVQNIIIY